MNFSCGNDTLKKRRDKQAKPVVARAGGRVVALFVAKGVHLHPPQVRCRDPARSNLLLSARGLLCRDIFTMVLYRLWCLFLYRTNVVAGRASVFPDDTCPGRKCRGVQVSNPLFEGHFSSKGDCFAAKVQERRLATTSINKMYGREVLIMLRSLWAFESHPRRYLTG